MSRKRKTVPVADFEKSQHEIAALENTVSNLEKALTEAQRRGVTYVANKKRELEGEAVAALRNRLSEVYAFNELTWWRKLLVFNKTFYV